MLTGSVSVGSAESAVCPPSHLCIPKDAGEHTHRPLPPRGAPTPHALLQQSACPIGICEGWVDCLLPETPLCYLCALVWSQCACVQAEWHWLSHILRHRFYFIFFFRFQMYDVVLSILFIILPEQKSQILMISSWLCELQKQQLISPLLHQGSAQHSRSTANHYFLLRSPEKWRSMSL